MVPRGRPLISIGYRYNARNVIYFTVEDNEEIIHAGLPYLSNYPDHFNNASIHPVAHPLIMYKLFGSVNEVESHNKSRQFYLELEKF